MFVFCDSLVRWSESAVEQRSCMLLIELVSVAVCSQFAYNTPAAGCMNRLHAVDLLGNGPNETKKCHFCL